MAKNSILSPIGFVRPANRNLPEFKCKQIDDLAISRMCSLLCGVSGTGERRKGKEETQENARLCCASRKMKMLIALRHRLESAVPSSSWRGVGALFRLGTVVAGLGFGELARHGRARAGNKFRRNAGPSDVGVFFQECSAVLLPPPGWS